MRTELRPVLASLAFGPFLALLAGCPGTLDDKARFLVDGHFVEDPFADAAPSGDGGLVTPPGDGGPCSDVPTRVFIPNCGSAGCHSSSNPQQGLDLQSPGVAARVVGVMGKECSGILANPANPQSSLLYVKVMAMPSCGAQMPLARSPLSNADIACIATWIAQQ